MKHGEILLKLTRKRVRVAIRRAMLAAALALAVSGAAFVFGLLSPVMGLVLIFACSLVLCAGWEVLS